MKRKCRFAYFRTYFSCEQALRLAQQFPDEINNFKATEGWLSQLKARYGICEIQVCGGKLLVDEDAVSPYCDIIRAFILEEGYVLDQTFNVDETDLNYKMLPEKTLALKSERSAPGAKRNACKE